MFEQGTMVLQSLLSEKKEALARKWFELTAQSYPPQTTEFLKSNRGQFTNPVGYSLRHGLGILIDELAGDMSQERVREALDGIVRIRAVQDFTPSEAVSFVFLIKNIVLQEIGGQIEVKELQAFYDKVDRIALIAFDVYMGCREDLFEVRVREVEKRNFRLLQVANQLFELKGDETLSELHEGVCIEKGKR